MVSQIIWCTIISRQWAFKGFVFNLIYKNFLLTSFANIEDYFLKLEKFKTDEFAVLVVPDIVSIRYEMLPKVDLLVFFVVFIMILDYFFRSTSI